MSKFLQVYIAVLLTVITVFIIMTYFLIERDMHNVIRNIIDLKFI